MATARSILQVIENYQKARTTFARTVAELASKPQNVEILHNAGVMVLLRPLLLDCVPQIQHLAALGLGRLASYSEELAEMVVSEKILVQILYPLREQNRHNKRAAANLLCAVAKHTEPLAQAVVDSGALDALVQCVEDFDPSVKEAGACALGNIARHSAKLAQAVVDARAVDVLTLCVQVFSHTYECYKLILKVAFNRLYCLEITLKQGVINMVPQEPELPLRRASAFTLGEIAKHSPELAQVVVDADTVHLIANLVLHSDSKLKRQVCQCLSQIAKHSVDLAEVPSLCCRE